MRSGILFTWSGPHIIFILSHKFSAYYETSDKKELRHVLNKYFWGLTIYRLDEGFIQFDVR